MSQRRIVWLLLWGLVVVPMRCLPATAQQPASTFAEIDLWQRVKESSDPAQVRSYLERYPNGEFAAVARQRLQALERSGARPGTPPATASPTLPPAAPRPSVAAPAPAAPAVVDGPAGAPVEMTPQATREIQQLLYDRGFRITRIDGRASDELRLAVERFQGFARAQPTGQLTYGQLGQLRRWAPASAWGAIAYTSSGVNFGVDNRPTRSTADDEAKAQCKKRTGIDCTIVSAAGKSCIAFAYSRGRIGNVIHHATTVGRGEEIEAAKDSAMRECRGLSKTPNACQTRRVVCADGRADALPEPSRKGGRRG